MLSMQQVWRPLLLVFGFLMFGGIQGQDLDAQVLQDVVYLKDGSIIRGTIIEQVPSESILIETQDGNRFRYLMSQIERMTKEPMRGSTAPQVSVVRREKSPGTAWALSFLFPGAGQFYNGDTTDGFWFLFRQLIFTGAFVEQSNCVGSNCNDDLVALWAGLVTLNWVWSQVDAYQDAKAINARSGGGGFGVDFGLGLAVSPQLRPHVVETPFGNRTALDLQILRWNY